ncbi:DUF3592 domain-containing protein [Streptomyces sp. D2-8]|uniref:DUF3592 domain-containing protein n=1 Tax=Streptomyces sp. D2-8 TaxID=2707767 RepID=UPI0020BFAC03|nr:DUF3592 domain-containing protein [Streptomyces sp. D2-8]MCK8433625.1 DUF3592 domain-containing protein [Streptomyces sp. D2-8]
MGKKKKRRSRSDWTLPPGIVKRNADQRKALDAIADRRRKVPQRRLIIGLFAAFIATFGLFLGFFISSHSLVTDLQSRGASAWAEVTSSPRDRYGSPGNIKVKFDGPEGDVETQLHDWGGMRPEGLTPGSRIPVVYDPLDPSRVLTAQWVNDPPAVTPPMLVALLVSLFFLTGVIVGTVRRRILLNEKRDMEATPERER